MGIRNFFGWKNDSPIETKAEETGLSGISGERKDTEIFKAFIPNFLYKPPFGMPRMDNPMQYKQIAKNPYVFSIIKTLCDEATSTNWEIRVKEEFQDDGKDYTEKINEITKFLKRPNKNAESFKHISRQLITDLLEVDSAVLVKVFSRGGELKEIFARDGSLFLKNTDIYGTIGSRADFVLPVPNDLAGPPVDMGGTPTVAQEQIMKQYSLLYKEQAAYFQYGWTAGSMPVPFGKREIIYMMQMPRTDNIYGTSPIARSMDIILNLVYGSEFNLDFYTNNNMPDGVIQLLGAKQSHIQQFRENFENQFKYTDELGNKRKRFFKHPISTTEVKFTPFQLSAKEMEVIAQQEWFTKILWMCFGVNADEMGFTQDSNKAEGENQSKIFKRKAVRPILDVLEYHLNSQLITEFFANGKDIPEASDIPLEFTYVTYDIDDDLKQHTLWEQQIRMGIKTPEMVAIDAGINIEELKKSIEETMPEEEEEEDNGFDNSLKSIKLKGGVGSGIRGHKTGNKSGFKNYGNEFVDLSHFVDSITEDADSIGLFKKQIGKIGKHDVYFVVEEWNKDCLESRDICTTNPANIKKEYLDVMKKETGLTNPDAHGYIKDAEDGDFGVSYIIQRINPEEKALGHKYIRRTGVRGKYTYIYNETKPKKKKKQEDVILSKEELKKAQQDSLKKNNAIITLALSKIPETKKKIIAKHWKNYQKGIDSLNNNTDKDGNFTKDRIKNVHKGIYAKYGKGIKKAEADGTPDVVFMAGIPGAGKTFNTKKIFNYSSDGSTATDRTTGKRYVIINADDIKGMLPEYDGGDGATFVHEESSALSKKIMAIAIRKNANVIFDGTLSNASSSLKKVKTFKDMGYTTNAIYVDTDVPSAIFNAASRFKSKGRYAHYEMIAEAEPSVRNTIKQMKNDFGTIKVIKATREGINWNDI